MYVEVSEEKIWVHKSTRDPLAVLVLDKNEAEDLVSGLKNAIHELEEGGGIKR